MSTVIATPRSRAVPLQRTRGGAPSRRAIRRWAWRLLRREWRQQVVILTLLIVAVATTVVGLGLVANVQNTDERLFGAANARIDTGPPGSSGLAGELASARQLFGTVEAIVHEAVPVPGSITPVDLRAEDPHGVFGAPMLRLVSGAFPVGAGEAAVTVAAETTFNVTTGSTWTVNGRSLRVVGVVENPTDLTEAFGLVAPGAIGSPSGVTLLFNASTAQVVNFRPPAGFATVHGIMSSGSNSAQQQRARSLAVLLLTTIGLTFIGLLSVAGFTVMAQRRVRSLGLIGAIGATDRQVRRTMIANGAAVGVVGAVFGGTLGLAIWFALTPAFEKVVGHRYDPFALPWWAIIAGAALAVVTAVAASWWPARTMARLPIVEALSGRPVPPQPAHRFALLGAILAAAGFVALTLARAERTVLIVSGILALAAGVLLTAPLGIRALAAFAGRAPVAVRLALRDLARYQARSSAALAAVSLAVGIAATIGVSAAAQQAHDQTLTGGNLPTNQLIVWLTNPNDQRGDVNVGPAGAGSATPGTPDPTALTRARSTADAIAQAVGSGTVVELDNAVDASSALPAGAPPDAGQASLVHHITVPGRGEGWTQVATPYVATTAVLSLYGITAAEISPGTDILSARRDLSTVQLGTGFKGDFHAVAVQTTTRLPNYTSAPNTLITARAVAANDYAVVPSGWLVQTGHPISSAQIADARQRAVTTGLSIETRTGPDQTLQRLRDYSTLIGVLVALGVLAMTIGLIRSETTADMRTLTAAGASGSTRRALNATSAAALGLLGGIMGTAAAYLALIAWHWHRVNYLDAPPCVDLGALVVGLPVAAALGSWLLGRTPDTLGRRPGE